MNTYSHLFDDTHYRLLSTYVEWFEYIHSVAHLQDCRVPLPKDPCYLHCLEYVAVFIASI